MLKHHPKLQKLWDKAPKIGKYGGSVVTLDRRFKATSDFSKELGNVMKQGIINDAREAGKSMKDLEDYWERMKKLK